MDEQLNRTKIAQKDLIKIDGNQRNQILIKIKEALLVNKEEIIKANLIDIEESRKNNYPASFIERLTLNEKRIEGLALSIDTLLELKDIIGEEIETTTRPNGLVIKKIRMPIGVIGVIFESRPNVTVDIAVLCLKSGNACVLKGGKESINTNKVLVKIMKDAIKDIVNPNVICLIESTSREATDELITKKEYIDLLIPRGSKRLIQYIVNNAKIPFIETGAGNCHLYVHEKADLNKAIEIAINAKYQRPSVCNSIETILVDEKIASSFLPLLYNEFSKLKIEMRGDEKTRGIIPVNIATEEDYYTEYNDYICAIKIVSGLEEAIDHINKYSTKHSESIITEDNEAFEKFFNEVDSAVCYQNASTRFTDGGEFGFGAEIGISTSKMHARGPMGLREITTYKYKVVGNGQVRK